MFESEQQPTLLAPAPSSPQAQQQEFSPNVTNPQQAPAYARRGCYDIVQLETTGVTPQYVPGELLNKPLLYKTSIAAKLRSVGALDLASVLEECHTMESFARCNGCSKVRHFWNRCDNFYCPVCQPGLARERSTSIEWWAKQVQQPKHVVLTVRNSATITFQYVKWFKACITKLRRSAFARNWLGGCWSLEVTNEGKGWHLHAHLLVDARWIDPRDLSQKWARLVDQDFAIVKVKDARNQDYLREVTKYAVKGSELAGWSPFDIVTFINAFQGQRTFGVFGSLYGKRTAWAEYLATLTKHGKQCECGCASWKIFSADEWAWHQQTAGPVLTTKPNAPPPDPQLQLSGT